MSWITALPSRALKPDLILFAKHFIWWKISCQSLQQIPSRCEREVPTSQAIRVPLMSTQQQDQMRKLTFIAGRNTHVRKIAFGISSCGGLRSLSGSFVFPGGDQPPRSQHRHWVWEARTGRACGSLAKMSFSVVKTCICFVWTVMSVNPRFFHIYS